MAVRRCKKVDLKRIAKATGASFVTSLTNMEGEECFDAAMLGEAAEVSTEAFCDDELIVIKGYIINLWMAFNYWSIVPKKPTWKNCISVSDQKPGQPVPLFYAGPTTITATKWSGRFTTPCAW